MRREDKHDLAFAIVMTIIIALACCGCRTVRERIVERTDTITNTERVVEYMPDTVYVEIPPQEKERTTGDSTSHLETDYAQSDARINPDGTLYHDLRNKAGKKAVETKQKVVTLVKTQKIRKTESKTVEKELTWWQRMKIRCFPWLVVACVVLMIWTFRISILKVIKKMI